MSDLNEALRALIADPSVVLWPSVRRPRKDWAQNRPVPPELIVAARRAAVRRYRAERKDGINFLARGEGNR